MTSSLSIPDGRIGIIAGNGRFPIIFADNARKMGLQVFAVAHEGETESELEQHVDRIHWVKIGQLNKLVHAFKDDGVRNVVMLGGVKKTHIYSKARPDFRVLALAAKLVLWKDDDILRALAAELEKDGITICESTFGLDGILVTEGSLTSRQPTKKNGAISGMGGISRERPGVSISVNAWSSRIAQSWLSKRLKGPMRRSSVEAHSPRMAWWS